jgi:hypothetical protein
MGYSYLGAKISEPVDGQNFGGCPVVLRAARNKISGCAKAESLWLPAGPADRPPRPLPAFFPGTWTGRFSRPRRKWPRDRAAGARCGGKPAEIRPKIEPRRHAFPLLPKHLRRPEAARGEAKVNRRAPGTVIRRELRDLTWRSMLGGRWRQKGPNQGRGESLPAAARRRILKGIISIPRRARHGTERSSSREVWRTRAYRTTLARPRPTVFANLGFCTPGGGQCQSMPARIAIGKPKRLFEQLRV